MTFYVCATLLLELMMLAMLLHVVLYAGFTRKQKIWFILTFASVMYCAVAEYAVHCGSYNPRFAVPLTILTALQFAVSPLMGVFFSGALGQHSVARKAVWCFGVQSLFELAAAPFGWVFRFSDAGYFRGPLYPVYAVCYILALVYLVINMVLTGRRFRHRDARTVVMICAILVAGVLSMTLFNIHVAYIAIGFAACLCYIYYNDLVQEDTRAALIANQKRIATIQEHTVAGLASLIESRDTDTGGHTTRTGMLVRMIAENARREGVYADQIDEHFLTMLVTLAPMHDVGKIVVPDGILKKPGKLTAEEFELMKTHTTAGGDVVRQILEGTVDGPDLDFAANIVVYHHERWDGAGYPLGLAGDDIPLCARITAIADVYDALISERCYKHAIPPAEAAEIIRAESGSHFDPKLAAVFLRHIGEI